MDDTQQSETQQPNNRIKLCVVCGHLAFARYPVLVGHYNGDTFAGTEARLDRALQGRLSERRRMGLYPGPIGSNSVVLDSDAKPPGAIIVGLGEPAELSIGALRRTLRLGILAFAAMKVDEGRSLSEGADVNASALLIGAGEGGLDRSSCALALIQAASEAQTSLFQILPDGLRAKVRLKNIEIIELYEDRAVDTWRGVQAGLNADPSLAEVFELTPDVKQHLGGRKNAPIGRDPSWWQPIQITMSGDAHDRSLSFTVSGGLARAEARTIAANLDLVSPLIRRISRSRANDSSQTSPGRALFELLWPSSLKDRSSEERPRRLILDERSAGFPWEMLDDRRPWMSDETAIAPPAVRAGIVRQLIQTRFREDVVATRGVPKALVIGNPSAAPTGLPDLPNAQKEAKTIAELLLESQCDVTALIGAAAAPEQISRSLFTEAWGIIHISAHGVSEQLLVNSDGKKSKKTGIVLGGGVVLSPDALAKLAVSPAIVFVNCCHLGIGQTDLDERPEFAANVAVELIKLGVRCVIAAGWAVDDDAAAVFGEQFYKEMLQGKTFGEATWLARKAAYEKNLKSNTWGAYQCYGDPDYRLNLLTTEESIRDSAPDFVVVSEAIEAVRRIRDDLNIGLERRPEASAHWLKKIEEAVRNWRGQAELSVALAEAWGELGDLPKAIELYTGAIKNPDASFKVKAIEQLANLRARNAIATIEALAPEKRDIATAVSKIEDALQSIQTLIDLLGETRERRSLQGGCWKRIAQARASQKNTDVDAALEEMAKCYDRAAAIEEEGDKSYPLLMACSARICRAVRTEEPCDDSVAERLKTLIDSKPPEDADFWRLILWADARMNDTILRLSNPSEEQTILEASYRRAWRHVGSPIKLRSVVEQLKFYEDIFFSGDTKTESKRQSVSALVKALRNTLEVEFLSQSPK